MLCLILGDSIAVGIYEQSRCSAIAAIGVTSTAFVRSNIAIPEAELTIISLGSNDRSSTSYNTLSLLRSRIPGRVVWVLPANNDHARAVILSVAFNRNDSYIDLRLFPLYRDGVHPRNYRAIAEHLGVSR
jgi:hypothetical protein